MSSGEGLGCSGTCAKYILFIVNFAIFLSGAAMLGVALAIYFADTPYFGDIAVDTEDPLIEITLYLMMGVGGFLFFVGFFGCCGACKENKCMLTTYVFLVIIALLAQVAGIVLTFIFLDYIDTELSQSMQKSVKEDYGVTPTTTNAWDAMQFDLKCCGAVDHEDYVNSTYSNNTGNSVPKTCCAAAIKAGDGYNITDGAVFESCKTNATAGNEIGYHTQGCYDDIKSQLEEYSWIVIGVLIGLAVIQIASVMIACCVKRRIKDDFYVD